MSVSAAGSASRSSVVLGGRSVRVLAAVLGLAVGAASACTGGGVGGSEPDGGGTGGASTGGATSSGGAAQPGTGGAVVGSGGASTPGTGGNTASGGASQPGSGGAPGSGGTAQPGSGGATAGTGGRSGTGGASNTGGVSGTGGARTGGATGSGGATGTGGARTGGAPGTGGAGTGGASNTTVTCTWPTAAGSPVSLSASMKVTGSYDGGMKRFVGSGPLGGSGQDEGQDPLFDLSDGATLSNVIIGNPAADGVHCAGTCTLKNVWWEDVGEDAATSRGSSASLVMTIDGGGAKAASDKVFQHNGAGTMVIKNFCAQDFGKLYRSCGNCSTQYGRHVQIENVKLVPRSGSVVAGVNSNYNDTATFKKVTVQAKADSITICQRFTGNNTGDEPPKNGAGADGKTCVYQPADIVWTP